jgi:zinc transporter 5/7
MASSYALPASAITHTHSHHGHVHSHSHSPGRHPANTQRSMRQERPIGNTHSYSASESHLGYIHEHPGSPHYEREASPYLEPVRAHTPGHDDPFGMTDDIPPQEHLYQPPSNIISHEHSHRKGSHARMASATPRSRFTNFILPYALPWPLLHTILANKDSRRIFYFMRYSLPEHRKKKLIVE